MGEAEQEIRTVFARSRERGPTGSTDDPISLELSLGFRAVEDALVSIARQIESLREERKVD